MDKKGIVNIKGKNYTIIAKRIQDFLKGNPNSSINTEILKMENDYILFKSTIIPNIDFPARCFTGHSYEEKQSSFINKTSYVENAETSAIGRALAAAGYGGEEAFASAEEVANAIKNQGSKTYVLKKENPKYENKEIDKEMNEHADRAALILEAGVLALKNNLDTKNLITKNGVMELEKMQTDKIIAFIKYYKEKK
jgi:hypothetical protein